MCLAHIDFYVLTSMRGSGLSLDILDTLIESDNSNNIPVSIFDDFVGTISIQCNNSTQYKHGG
jgi:hypothetical protein